MKHHLSIRVLPGKTMKSLSKYSRYRSLEICIVRGDPIDLKHLTDCPLLRKFTLRGGTVTGILGIEYCSMLESIKFSEVDLSHVDLSILGQLPNLVSFSTSHSILDRDASLGQSESLLRVTLLDTQGLDDLRILQGIRLTHLAVRHYSIKSLEGLFVDDLVALYAFNNSIESLAPLREAHKLQTLVLTHNQISSVEEILELKGLTTLYLCGNPIEDQESIKKMSERLELTYHRQMVPFFGQGDNCTCGCGVDIFPEEDDTEQRENVCIYVEDEEANSG